MVDEPEHRAEIDTSLQEIYRTLFLDSNPILVKAALNLLGHRVGGLRLPLVEADPADVTVLRTALDHLGLLDGVPA
jgi:4-hydroxy-tetrahydrodipicolinate synthase